MNVHDPGHLLLRRAARVAIVLPLAYLFTNYVLKMPEGAPYTVFGTFVLLSFADFGGPTADRARAYLLTGLVGLVAVLLGTFAALNPIAAVISTFIVGAGLTYSGLLRGYVATATMAILLPFVIAVTAGPALDQLTERLLGFAVAVVFSLAAALLMWPSHNRSALRQRVADTIDASANVVRALWPDVDGEANSIDLPTRQRELTEAHHKMREQYDGRLMRPGGATARDRALMQTIDELGRLRIMLRWEPNDEPLGMPGDDDLATCAASTLDAAGEAIGRDGPAPQSAALDRLREAHRLELERWSAEQLQSKSAETIRPTLDAGFHLRLTAAMAEMIARHTRVAVGAPPESSPFTALGAPPALNEVTPGRILRNHLTFRSPWFRNSLRAGLALAIAVTVVYLTGVEHGFWVVLGTLTALRLDALGTGKTAVQAITGTVAGFVIGSAIVIVLGPYPISLWILLPIAVFLSGYTPGAISLAVGQASFTIFVIVFYGIVAGPTLETGELRVLDVGIGLAISLVVSAMMWPRGVAARINETLAEAIHASTAYLVAAYDRLVQGPVANHAVEKAAIKADAAVSTAYETFDLTIAQGGTNTEFGPLWSFVANAAGHISASADLVLYLASIGGVTTPCPEAGDMLISCSHLVATNANAAVDSFAPKMMNAHTQEFLRSQAFNTTDGVMREVGGLGDAFTRLEDRVDTCLDNWQSNPPALDSETIGQQALALVWAEEWLVHLMWVAKRIQLAYLASEQPPTPTVAPNGSKGAK